MSIYRIKNWDINFENNRTRELKKISWVPLQNSHDGDGYTELVDHKSGASHFGCWVAIVQVASRCDPRGTLLRHCGNGHNSASISRMTRLPQSLIDETIKRCTEIGWIEDIDQKTAIPHEGAAIPHEGAAIPHDPALKERKKERKKEGEVAPQFPAVLDTLSFKEKWGLWKKYRTEIKKKLVPSTEDAQLKKLALHGPDIAAKMLQQSIDNQWTGIFDLKDAAKVKDEDVFF